MTTDEIFRELMRLMNRKGPGTLPYSLITLKDGSSFKGIPFSVNTGSHFIPYIQFVTESGGLPRGASIADIAAIEDVTN